MPGLIEFIALTWPWYVVGVCYVVDKIKRGKIT